MGAALAAAAYRAQQDGMSTPSGAGADLSAGWNGLSDLERTNLSAVGVQPSDLQWDDVSGKHYAADTYSDLIRGQWTDYVTRFLPVQNQLINDLSGTKLLDEQLGRISGNTRRAAKVAQLDAKMRDARYGVQKSRAYQSADTVAQASASALANASGMNETRAAYLDRRDQMLYGAVGRADVLANNPKLNNG